MEIKEKETLQATATSIAVNIQSLLSPFFSSMLFLRLKKGKGMFLFNVFMAAS
jgi:hypothetical protein